MEQEIKKLEVVELEECERGASMVEYALLLALIAVVCIAGVLLIGKEASKSFSGIGSSIAAGNTGLTG